ncbi:MAG: hypothetical protein ACHQQS_09045 [Thermoanaerobaculales bacterium]
MSSSAWDRCAAALGARVAGLATAGIVAGAAAALAAFLADRAALALGALAAAWLFAAGIAAGGVAFSAAVRCARGRWAAAALPAVEALAGFFPAALALLAVLVLAARLWIPGASEAGMGSWAWRCVRDLGGTALLFAAATRFLRRSRITAAPEPSGAAIAYLLLYVAVLSLWAVDLVMDLHEWAPSTVIPPFVFIGAFLGAIAVAAVAMAGEAAATTKLRGDLGKLLFAMVIFWGYLAWAAYLPVWYGNLPDETGMLVARWAGSWKYVTSGVLVTVLGFPFFFLLPEKPKRRPAALAAVALTILAGLLGERFLLVLPSLDLRLDAVSLLIGAGITAGVLGLFVLAFGSRLGAAKTADSLR